MSAVKICLKNSLRFLSQKSLPSNLLARNIATSPSFSLSASRSVRLNSKAESSPGAKQSSTPPETAQQKPPLHPNETGIEHKIQTVPPADSTFPPEAQDFFMEKIDLEYLKQMCSSIWFTADPDSPLYSYLETAEVLPKKLPLRGAILGLNRMWINLICQVELGKGGKEGSHYTPARNVTFVVVPSSPYSYISKHALEYLIHGKGPVPESAKVMIHPSKVLGVEEMHVSPMSSHFAGANILGNEFFRRNKLALFINYRKNHFDILSTSEEEGLF